MTNRQKAINFWKVINEKFPHTRVQNWIATLENDEAVDWFRNFGLAKIAVSANSTNSKGLFSNAKYEQNEKTFKQIVAWHSDVTSLMQN